VEADKSNKPLSNQPLSNHRHNQLLMEAVEAVAVGVVAVVEEEVVVVEADQHPLQQQQPSSSSSPGGTNGALKGSMPMIFTGERGTVELFSKPSITSETPIIAMMSCTTHSKGPTSFSLT